MSEASTSRASSTAPLALSNLERKLETTVPSAIRRQGTAGSSSRLVPSTLRGSHNRKLPPADADALPDGWRRYKHPDAGIYYVHADKGVSTASDMTDMNTRALVVDGAEVLRRSAALQALLEDQAVDVVLDVPSPQGAGPPRALYYCVSHAERRVFWLEGIGHEAVEIRCTSNKCVQSKVSRVHCIEAQYWRHCELFPTTFAVTKDVTGDLKDVLLQAAADRLLVKFSTSPFDKEALECMLSVVKEIEEDIREGSGHAAWIVARFMALYNDGMLQSSYGQSDDYFDIEDTGPALGPYQRHWLLFIIGPVFFKSPDTFAVELHSFHESFTLDRWSNFVHKVDQSIRDSNLLATVLLTTNMGFLAWSDTARTGGINHPTPVQIVTFVSTICSVGSIIIGLAIFKQYRAKGADTPIRAIVVLKRILKEPLGLERLAIICSLPYVLLMWSLITFLAAFGIIFYQDTGIDVRIPVTLTLFIVLLFLFFCMHTAGPPDKENQKRQKRSREDKEAALSKV